MKGSEFAEMRAFAMIATEGSFSRAANQLHVSPSALSQSIRLLEARLNTRLFNRTTRNVALTEAGNKLYNRLKPLLHEFDSLTDSFLHNHDSIHGTIRINLPTMAARHLIRPHIGEFHKTYPDINVEFVIDNGLSNIVSSGFDAGIRLGEKLEKDMIARPIGPELRLVTIASPDYLAKNGCPESPYDLADHACVNFRHSSSGAIYAWEYEKDGQPFEVLTKGAIIANDPDLLLQAVVDGAGIGYMMENDIAHLRDQNQLVTLFEEWSPPFPGYYLYYPDNRHQPPALRVFSDFFCAASRHSWLTQAKRSVVKDLICGHFATSSFCCFNQPQRQNAHDHPL